MLEWLVAALVGFVAVWVMWWLGYWPLPSSGGESTSPAPPEDIPGWTCPPADPVLGDMGEVQASGSLQNYLSQQHQGGKEPIIAFWWKEYRVVSISSPKAFKDAENLSLNPLHILSPSSAPLHGSNGIENVNGADWERKRSCLYNTVRGDHQESFIKDFISIAEETVTMWRDKDVLLLKEAMFRLTLKAILSTSMGLFSSEEEERGEGLERVAALYDWCKRSVEERMFAASPPSQEQEKTFQENVKSLRGLMRMLLHSRKEQTSKEKALPLIDALLASGVPEDEALSDMVTFVGGFHTSGIYMMWVFLYLAQYPDIQDKLAQELRAKVGEDRGEKLKAYVLTSDSYLRQVLDEIMRLSAISAFIGHISKEALTVEGYHLPADTPILYAMGVALHDPSSWGEDFASFKPERFAPGTRHAKRGREFRPFGVCSGRRCPANIFTYTMVSVYLTVLIQHFSIEAVGVGADKVKREYGIAVSPHSDTKIKVSLRKL